MPRITLTAARVTALRPRKTAYDIRDGKLRGFGVRVMPSGRKRFFVHCQHAGERVWKIVGDAETMTVGEARSRAAAALAAIRRAEEPPRDPEDTLLEAVAETVFEHYRRLWKPATLNVNRGYLRQQILPHFAGRQVADIDSREVRNWFAALSATPVAADRSMPVLSVIMKEADIIRLLLLTGCRRGEIVQLRWDEVQHDALMLKDGKTGARKVPLNSQARRIFERRPRGESEFVFPSPLDPSRPRSPEFRLWYRARREAGIEDVRLHDLRHTVASHAVMNGVPVPVVSRLLGHANVSMTLRYAHLGDRDIEDAAERVGQAVAAIMGLGTQLHPLDASSDSSSG